MDEGDHKMIIFHAMMGLPNGCGQYTLAMDQLLTTQGQGSGMGDGYLFRGRRNR
jgi:hypothetical protein